jgi:hypothetical protein
VANKAQFAACMEEILLVLGENEMDPYQAATALAGMITITCHRLKRAGFEDESETIKKLATEVLEKGFDINASFPAKPGSPSN